MPHAVDMQTLPLELESSKKLLGRHEWRSRWIKKLLDACRAAYVAPNLIAKGL